MAEPRAHFVRRKLVETGLRAIGGAGKARVLMYHGVGEAGRAQPNTRHIAADVFARQLDLARKHFHVVALDRLLAGERHPRKLTVALTFDDGLRNNLSHAWPLLKERELPATFFVTGAARAGLTILWGDLLDLAPRRTDRPLHIDGRTWRPNSLGRYAVDGTGPLLRDHIKQAGGWAPKQQLYDQLADLVEGPLQQDRLYWQLLSEDELQELAAEPLVTLGSHGWRHNDMGQIPAAEVEAELRASKEHLRAITGAAPSALAWPSGSYSPEGVRIATDLGFTQQLGVDVAPAEAAPVLGRYGMFDFPVSDRWLRHLVAEGAR